MREFAFEACLEHLQDERSPHTLARILRVLTEALMRFSGTHHPNGLHTTLLSRLCLGTGGMVGSKHTPQGGVGSLQLPRASLRVHGRLCPLDDLLQHCQQGEMPEKIAWGRNHFPIVTKARVTQAGGNTSLTRAWK